MIKSFLIILGFSGLVLAQQQLLLVVSESYESTEAKLYCYEGETRVFEPIRVHLGAKGLAWGVGQEMHGSTKHPQLKKEGDKKAPAGIFPLKEIFGYHENKGYDLPYLQVTKETICVDASDSALYNQIVAKPKHLPASYEDMRREDHQYELGIMVGHNEKGEKEMGSCIFIHVQKDASTPSAGCTTMEYEALQKIIFWLEREKNPTLIQIQKDSLAEIQKIYPQLKNHKEDTNP